MSIHLPASADPLMVNSSGSHRGGLARAARSTRATSLETRANLTRVAMKSEMRCLATRERSWAHTARIYRTKGRKQGKALRGGVGR